MTPHTKKLPTRWMSPGLAMLLTGISLGACAAPPPTEVAGLELEEGYRAELFTAGLVGPTQMILAPDGRIWLAQLAGPESAGTGQILILELEDPAQRQIVLDGLFKPTGIALLNGQLWIASGRDLLRAELDSEGRPEQPEVVLEQLPFNGRSNGTLTISPDQQLIYETSGSRHGSDPLEGSASLWSLDPNQSHEPRLIAGGFKNAYSHTFDARGQLWVSDIADDPVNGMAPPDELNLVMSGADYGWPACFGDRQPATNYGGTQAACAATEPAVAVLPAQSTPTSVVVSPWEDDVLLVALWGPTDPSVLRVRIEYEGGQASAVELSPFLTGLAHPQSLLVLPDASLLVSDFESGSIYRLWRR